nr:glycosyltransferase family 39 protein [uncultured Carboxylicivirga sp.]
MKFNIETLFRSGLFWSLLLGLTLRNLYLEFNSNLVYIFDTVSYTYAAENILHGLIDNFRTPFYPFILSLIKMINPLEYFENVLIFQHIVSYLSIIPFYFACKIIFKNKVLSVICSIFYSAFPYLLYYNYCVYPESLFISFIVLFLFFMISYLEKPAKWNIIGSGVIIFLLVMIKPAGILFYGIVGFVLLFRFLIKNTYKKMIFSFAISIIGILGYCTLNYVQNDYWGLSIVTQDNNFLNVIHSKAYRLVSDEKFANTIDTCISKGDYTTMHWMHNEHDIIQEKLATFPVIYPDNEFMKSLRKLPYNNLGYNRDTVAPLISDAMKTSVYIKYMFEKVFIFSNRTFFSCKGYYYILIIALLFLTTIVRIFIFKEILEYNVFLLLTTILIVMLTIVGGVDDSTWERVLLPVIPFIILLLGSIISDCITIVVKSRERVLPVKKY